MAISLNETESHDKSIPKVYITKYDTGYGWCDESGNHILPKSPIVIDLCIAGVKGDKIDDYKKLEDYFGFDDALIIRKVDTEFLQEHELPVLKKIAEKHGVELVIL